MMKNLLNPLVASGNWEIIQGRLQGTIPAAGSIFDKSPTTGIIAFEILVILGVLASVLILSRFSTRKGGSRNQQ